MSDLMLLGVLRMPIDPNSGPVALTQFFARAREAADRIESDAAEIERLRAALAQPPAPTTQPASPTHSELPDEIRIPLHKLWADAGYLVGRARAGDVDLAVHRIKALCDEVERAIRAQPVQQPGAEPLHGGMDNAELLSAWKKKLPGVEPSDAQLTAFAVGVEVGFSHARDLERQDWSRVHHALAKHGVHPGRTDDHLADVIDRALAAPAQRQPLPPGLRLAAAFTRADLGPDGSNYPHVRELLAFAEQALGITAAPEAQKGEKL